MFLCTARGSVILKTIPSLTFEVKNLKGVLDAISLSPVLESSGVDAIVLTSDDINSRSAEKDLKEKMSSKHPDNIVIFINKKKKRALEDITNLDANLTAPTVDDIRELMTDIISKRNFSVIKEDEDKHATVGFINQEKDTYESNAEPAVASESPAEELPGLREAMAAVETPKEEPVESTVEATSKPVESPEISATAVAGTASDIPDLGLVPSVEELNKRFDSKVSPAELQSILNDISLENIIRDISAENNGYAAIQDKLSTLRVNIERIMLSDDELPLETKLERIRALVYEEEHCLSNKNVYIGKYVSSIISTITSVVLDKVNSRVNELNNLIVTMRPTAGTLAVSDIRKLKENRTNALVELDSLASALASIELELRKLGTDTVSMFIDEQDHVTNNYLVNEQIHRKAPALISEDTVNAIRNVYNVLTDMPNDFQAVAELIKTTRTLIHKMFDMDNRLIEELERVVERLSLSDIAKASVAKNLEGKVGRVWYGGENSGRSIIPYIFAKMQAKEKTVLYVNLTGSNPLEPYGIQATTLGEFISNPLRKEFEVVCGEISMAAPIDEIASAIRKASCFYSYIHIVMDDSSIENIKIMSDLSVAAYSIVNLGQGGIKRSSEIVRSLTDVACVKSIVFNGISNIEPAWLEPYGVEIGSPTTTCFSIRHYDEITTCGMNGMDPSELPSIHTGFAGLRKHV